MNRIALAILSLALLVACPPENTLRPLTCTGIGPNLLGYVYSGPVQIGTWIDPPCAIDASGSGWAAHHEVGAKVIASTLTVTVPGLLVTADGNAEFTVGAGKNYAVSIRRRALTGGASPIQGLMVDVRCPGWSSPLVSWWGSTPESWIAGPYTFTAAESATCRLATREAIDYPSAGSAEASVGVSEEP